MTINSTNGVSSSSGYRAQQKSSTSPGETSFDDILENFKKIASQTPAERAAESVLKRHGLTRQQFDKLPQAQKDGIQKEIEEAVRRAVGVRHGDGSKLAGL